MDLVGQFVTYYMTSYIDKKKNMETEHRKTLCHSDRAVLNGSKARMKIHPC